MEEYLNVRDRLVAAGIRELNANGVQGFSVRRIAQSCGLSCAAPYKHFRDKNELLEAVADAINSDWIACQAKAVAHLAGDTAAQLRAICQAYLRFLRDNPNFCALIIQRDTASGKWLLNRLFDQSSLTKRLIAEYARERGLSESDVYGRVYAIRAMLYGAAMMNQRDEMHLTDPVLLALDRVIQTQI